MTSNLVQRHIAGLNLGRIDHNLHICVFDDVICKPPTVFGSSLGASKTLEGKEELLRSKMCTSFTYVLEGII